MKFSRNLLLSAVATAALLTVAGGASARDYLIHAGHLIDGVTKTEQAKVSVLVHNDRIVSVQTGFVDAPKGAELVDLSDSTLLPGFIDCHDHITQSFHPGDPIRNTLTRTDFDDELDGVNNLKAELMAGFTSIRDVGGSTPVVVALKRGVAKGVIPGPRLWVAGAPISPTGGHGDPANGLDPELAHPGWNDTIVDSPEAARRIVRTLKRQGADLIKILPSGGVMSIGDDPKLQLMADDEIKAVIDTAHALGMKVAAHAHGEIAINHAIELGVDSIEHGSYADDASYKLFKQHGTYLVPTMLVGARVYIHAKEHPEDLNPSTAEKALVIGPLLKRNLHDAYAAGVKIAFGTDTFGMSAHGENGQEFAIMVDAGMPAMEAIWAATHNAADLLGSSEVGAVAAGKYADMVAVRADPLSDIKSLEHPSFIMKGGVIYKSGQ